MKNFLKLGLVVVGFTMATLASTEKASADISKDDSLVVGGAGCVGESGTCGRTSNGTTLYGKWREW